MKQVLLFFLIGFLSVSVYAQQGPPPPAGYTPVYFCDEEAFDGFATLDLTILEADIEEFEGVTIESFTYSYSEGFDSENFSLDNPSSFTNLTNPYSLYISPSGRVGRTYIVTIIPQFEINKPTPLVVCDSNSDGYNNFNLSSKDKEILAGLSSDIFEVNYFLNENDALNVSNQLNKNSYINITNPQRLYSRVNPRYGSNCFEITEFDLKVQDTCEDIAVYLTSVTSPRPGFDYKNQLIVKNTGNNTVASGQVEFIYDTTLDFIEVTGVDSGNSILNTSTGFILNFTKLEPNQEERIYIRTKIPIPTPLGTLLTNEVTYLGSDLDIENNTSNLSEVVIGAYDPNDILESHGPIILHSSFESTNYLYYTIRFQNVGTADAINVSIDNTLDNRLDKSTIQMLSSSHNNVFVRTDNQLNWQFNNIHLPSEDMDEPNSHGYVYYKIKPLAGYSIGDIIPNTAEIYFDFNEAVITNTFETEFTTKTTLSNREFNEVEFSIFPNPVRNSIELRFKNTTNNDITTTIYDIQGKLILNSKNELQNNAFQLNVSSLKSGMYFIKVNDGINESIEKLIKK